MKCLRPLVLAPILLVAAGPVSADVIVLYDGQTIEGMVVESGARVSIRTDSGTVTLPRPEVARITHSKHPLHELEVRRKAVKPKDAEGLIKLAKWAAENQLPVTSKKIYEEVVEIEPDNETARSALGHVRSEGRWMTEEEYMNSKGLVRHKNTWMPREAVAVIEAEDRKLEAERERLQTVERIAKLQADIERAKIEEARKRRKQEEIDRFFIITALTAQSLPSGGKPHQHRTAGGVFTCTNPACTAPSKPSGGAVK